MTKNQTVLLLLLPLCLLASSALADFVGGKLIVKLVDESSIYIEDFGNGKPEVKVRGQVEPTDEGAKQRILCDDLGLALDMDYVFNPGRAEVTGRLRDTTGKDRAIIVKFTLPLDARGGTWWDDIRTSRKIENVGAYHNWTGHGDSNGRHSVYPFSCISKDVSVCIGIPLNTPIIHRISYDSEQMRHQIAFDLGLSPDMGKSPGAATFRFVIYGAEAEWGFRAAAKRYYEIFPESFDCRACRQGIWQPFTKISAIEKAEDFGFGFQEGAGDVAYDDAHNILSFVYVEPWSLRFYLPPDVKDAPSPEEALEHPAVKGKQDENVAVAKTCGIHTKDGKYSTRMYTADWARGKTVYDFLVSADPEVAGDVTKAKVMDKTIFGRFEKEEASGNNLDGVYFDGFGEWRGPSENYRRDLWRTADYPLTFSYDTKKPVQLTCFTVYEYVAHMAKKLKPKKGYLMANGFMYGFPFTAHHLDVVGNEIHWMRQTGADDAYLDLRRTMAYQRPYLPLNNEDFTVFCDREVEKYFTKCLYYGFLPSMFSPGASSHDNFWNTAEFHNRERHLFKKYIPTIIKLAEAGWEPIPHAWSEDPKIRLDRFGTGVARTVHITVYNDTNYDREYDIKIDAKALGISPQDNIIYDLVSRREIEGKDDWGKLRIRGALPPRGVAALWLTSKDRAAGWHVALAMKHIVTMCDRIAAGKMPDADKKSITAELQEIARQLRMSPFDDRVLAAQMAAVRRLCMEKGKCMAGFMTDLQDLGKRISLAQMILSGLHLEIGGDLTAPAGRPTRAVIKVGNRGRAELRDVKIALMIADGMEAVGSASLTSLQPGEARELDMTVPVPKDARVGGYLPLLARLIADREARPFLICVDSSLIVSPLCDVAVTRCEDGPKFAVTVRNNARSKIGGKIAPKPPTGWTVDPGETAIALDGLASGQHEFTFKPPQDAKAGMVQAKVAVTVEGMEKPFEQDLTFGHAPMELNLLKNGGFEQGKESWETYEKGFEIALGGRKGGSCLKCENAYPIEFRGASQEIVLDQKKAAPLLLCGWSKAENVSGGKNKDYSVYVDIQYADGTPLYGQTIDFTAGAHDWEYAEALIEPAKPVKSLRLHVLFRRHSGKVWFDDIRICEVGK
ncbi:MAG: NEW3 domain-containing protein [Planctomycetota bacterium]